MRSIGSSVVFVASLASLACQAPSSPVVGNTVVGNTVVGNTVVANEGEDNAFAWLAEQFDTDGDGQITPDEFDRVGVEYRQLDRNGDGVIDAADYPVSSEERRDWNAMPASFKARMDSMYAGRAVMLTYFQPEPDATELSQEALLRQFDALDTDKSSDIDESEFACATDPQPWGGPGQAWPLLIAAVDQPGDGDQRLGRVELTEYHGKFANDEGVVRGAPARTTTDGDRSFASDGAPVGTEAPDFLLEPLGGGVPVALSDFRGDRAVALIFGSYT